MVIVIMNLFIFGKPAPSFFFSESVPPPHSQEAKAFFLRENGKHGRHMAGQVVGGGHLLNIPLIQFCASVKYKLQGFHSFNVWTLQMLRPEMPRVDLISPSVNGICTHAAGIHLLIQQLILFFYFIYFLIYFLK